MAGRAYCAEEVDWCSIQGDPQRGEDNQIAQEPQQ